MKNTINSLTLAKNLLTTAKLLISDSRKRNLLRADFPPPPPPMIQSPAYENFVQEVYDDLAEAAQDVGVLEWLKDKAQASNLFELIRQESGFKLNAQNPLSSAFGLFQMIKSTWNALVPEASHGTSDPYWQSVGGLRYIKKYYKSPQRAQAFRQATLQRNPLLAPEDLQDKANKWISKGYIGY